MVPIDRPSGGLMIVKVWHFNRPITAIYFLYVHYSNTLKLLIETIGYGSMAYKTGSIAITHSRQTVRYTVLGL